MSLTYMQMSLYFIMKLFEYIQLHVDSVFSCSWCEDRWSTSKISTREREYEEEFQEEEVAVYVGMVESKKCHLVMMFPLMTILAFLHSDVIDSMLIVEHQPWHSGESIILTVAKLVAEL